MHTRNRMTTYTTSSYVQLFEQLISFTYSCNMIRSLCILPKCQTKPMLLQKTTGINQAERFIHCYRL